MKMWLPETSSLHSVPKQSQGKDGTPQCPSEVEGFSVASFDAMPRSGMTGQALIECPPWLGVESTYPVLMDFGWGRVGNITYGIRERGNEFLGSRGTDVQYSLPKHWCLDTGAVSLWAVSSPCITLCLFWGLVLFFLSWWHAFGWYVSWLWHLLLIFCHYCQ